MRLPEELVEFVCRRAGELLLLNGDTAETFSVPEERATRRALELEPNSPARLTFFRGQPLWVWAADERSLPRERLS